MHKEEEWREEYCCLMIREEGWREEYCCLVRKEERRVYCSLVYNDREGGILFFSSQSREGGRECIYCSLVHKVEREGGNVYTVL